MIEAPQIFNIDDELCEACSRVLRRLLHFIEGKTHAQFMQRDYAFTAFEASAKEAVLYAPYYLPDFPAVN